MSDADNLFLHDFQYRAQSDSLTGLLRSGLIART